MALYELLILGSPTPLQVAELKARVTEVAASFDLAFPGQIALRTTVSAASRDRKAASAAAFFGGDVDADINLLLELQHDQVPIVPIVAAGANFSNQIPVCLHATNGYFLPTDDLRLEGLAALLLECVGLLHEQRRVFVSYRRSESRQTAVQIHDELCARNFDVFLDTHDIRPGQLFQDKLWHRLVDCDVVIMLDTPEYFDSKWTTQEVGRALAKRIHVLRLVWPGHIPSRHLSLSETIYLTSPDFVTGDQLNGGVIDDVVQRTEHLRSRSIATRHLELSGKLRVEVERIGGRFEGVGAHRSMSLSLPSGKRVWAYPAVGVPTADLLNDVHQRAEQAAEKGFPLLIYDHIGIQDVWLQHLKWLDEHIAAVKAFRVMDVAWELVKWDS